MKIAIIEDHQLFAECLKIYFERMGIAQNVQLFENGRQFLQTAGWNPDLVLTDLMMEGISGVELIKELADKRKREKLKYKIIVLSSVEDYQIIKKALFTGASGYLSKNTRLEELSEAIEKVTRNENYISSYLQKNLINNILTENEYTLLLSPREKELLYMVCDGITLKEAAYQLNLSIHTIRNYYRSIMKKFNVHRTVDLIKFAIEKGLYFPKTQK
ncbi:response regulator transcription factor [Ravibacter arvi]|uniref:Response regulator transcription factor n=1 Tax=Ravibacter arvi TaxID=2051041 RepID=A0ABP8MBC3_9BACT